MRKITGVKIKNFGEFLINEEKSKATLEKYLAKLDALNPAAVLKRGFASVKDDRGKIIKSVKNLEKGSFIDVTFADGCAKCSVNSVAEGR